MRELEKVSTGTKGNCAKPVVDTAPNPVFVLGIVL